MNKLPIKYRSLQSFNGKVKEHNYCFLKIVLNFPNRFNNYIPNRIVKPSKIFCSVILKYQ